LETPKKIETKDVILYTGRTRMLEIVVFIFLLLRGHFSSMSDRFSLNYLKESISLHCFLQLINIKMPGKNTINDNLNCISNETREYILQKQLQMILDDGLDDFEKAYIDSTAVKGSTCWPTDAGIILSFLARVYKNSNKFKPNFNLSNFNKGQNISRKLKKLKSILFEINMVAGKPNSTSKIKKQYKSFLSLAKKIHDVQIKEFQSFETMINEADLKPTKRKQLDYLWTKIEDDLSSISYVIYYAEERIFNGVVLKSSEKILSISDESAAFIKKGNRVPVIGYKPQLTKSANGFITSLLIEEGNQSDSSQLIPVFEDIVKNTNIIPKVVSTDDGYSSKKGRETLLNKGVKIMSINGGKGKNITPDADWNSAEYQNERNYRSGIESVIFTIKYLFQFGTMRRRGIDNVKAEMLEKIIAYNFYKINWLKNKKKKKGAG